MRGLVVVAALVGCYAPSAAVGVECSANNTCPEGQTCNLVTRICDGVTPSDGGNGVDADVVLGPWGMPSALAELNSSNQETDPTMTADGLEIIFSSNRDGFFLRLFIAKRASVTDPFGTPEPIGFQTAGDEVGADLSGDGLELHFSRPRFAADLDIFRATRPDRNSSFGPPERVAALSSDRTDRNPTISPNGLFAMVDVELSQTNRDLFYFTRTQIGGTWVPAGVVSELATPAIDAGPVFDASGDTLYLHSNRNGQNELFVTSRENKNKPFAEPAVITEVGAGNDPWVSPDQRVLVFARDNDLFFATR